VRFLLDEGLPFRLARFLRSEGHDVAVCGIDHPHTLADRAILAIAYDQKRLLLTNEKHFGNLVFRDRQPHAGVILFRLGYDSINDRTSSLMAVLTEHAAHLDQFIIVSPHGSRIASAHDVGRREFAR
jgi:predicted nuclease of predicted toxin-antitoxin system